MTLINRLCKTILCLGCLTLLGCSSAKIQHQFYALADAKEPLASVRSIAASTKNVVGIGPIELPARYDRSAIVSYDGAHKVNISETHYWAGDIKIEISRKLAKQLSAAFPQQVIWPFPWDTRIRPETQVGLTFLEFGGELGGDVNMLVSWRLLSNKGRNLLKAGEFSVTEKTENNSHEAYVAALNHCVESLALYLQKNVLAQVE